jgi:hypothetical protein
MALVDKMKAQAAQLAQKAQEAGKAGQAKLEDVQAKRRADGLLRDLGAAVYAQKNGTATDATAGEIDRLVGELQAYEAANGKVDDGATPTDETPSDETPEGGFKL